MLWAVQWISYSKQEVIVNTCCLLGSSIEKHSTV